MDISKIMENIRKYFSNLEKTDVFIIFLIIFSFLIRIIPLLYTPLRGWDETVYLNLGDQLSVNPFNYSLFGSGWNDYIPSTDIIYGWPNIGFRAPLLPYLLSIFYFLNLNFLIEIIMPFIGALSVFLVYILGRDIFNKKIGLYSALLFSLAPIHVYYSGQMLTDTFVVFFILLAFISFWKGYEKGNNKHKILFGFFLALSLLARYTTLWIFPVFFLYFLIRDKSFKFLKDRHLWHAILIFLLTLTPWLFYGFSHYGNVFGAFIHGLKAAGYWGGEQSWNFFFANSWQIFSIIGIIFIISLYNIFQKKDYIKKEVYLFLIWIAFFLGMVMYMPHKEDRFIMPIIPAVCIIAALLFDQLKKYKKIIISTACLILMASLAMLFVNEYQKSQEGATACFYNGNKFLADKNIDKNSLIINNKSPMVYYYTKKENRLYPEPWNTQSFKDYINQNFSHRTVYVFFANYDMSEYEYINKDLNGNFEKVFECSKEDGYSVIYKYK